MQIKIETVRGQPIIVDLGSVQTCYPEDDVIYFYGADPCKISTARDPRVDDLIEALEKLLIALETDSESAIFAAQHAANTAVKRAKESANEHKQE